MKHEIITRWKAAKLNVLAQVARIRATALAAAVSIADDCGQRAAGHYWQVDAPVVGAVRFGVDIAANDPQSPNATWVYGIGGAGSYDLPAATSHWPWSLSTTEEVGDVMEGMTSTAIEAMVLGMI